MRTDRRFMDRLAESVGSRYGALLLVLIVTLVLYGFMDRHSAMRWVLDVAFLAMIGSLVHAVSGRRWLKNFVIVAGLGTIVLGTLSRETDIAAIFPIASVTRAALYAVVIVVIFGDVLRRSEVDMDAVLGACCVYLLMGLAWEAAYSLIAWQIPNSFAMPQGASPASPAATPGSTSADLVYFSLITMTTVGYGDITPRTSPARVLAALQGVISQLYIAIIVARLVGMELARRQDSSTRSR